MLLSIITFPSNTQARKANEIMSNQGFVVELLPIPKELAGSSHGLAIQFNDKHTDIIKNVLHKNGIEYSNIIIGGIPQGQNLGT